MLEARRTTHGFGMRCRFRGSKHQAGLETGAGHGQGHGGGLTKQDNCRIDGNHYVIKSGK